MMGVLHKVVLEAALPQLAAFFPVLENVAEPLSMQRCAQLHSKQLGTPCGGTSSETMKRSLFGLARCYNQLPQHVVDVPTVSIFQHRLQAALKVHASSAGALATWPSLYTKGWRRMSRRDFHKLFAQ